MKLNLKDRLTIQNILPQEGDFTTLVIKTDLSNKLKTTQEEIKELEISSEGTLIRWNVDKDIEKDFDLTDLELNLIHESLLNLDKNKKLNNDTFSLYKKFK